ncbi:MAG: hypothetical protein EPO63_05745 [Candidatus Nitrosotenuis sp.]|nr:MAG: hypothetical protein EPO63_05745 [Candidatus Nitrosotenuis sp.]
MEAAIPTFDTTIPMYDYIISTNDESLQVGFSIEAYADKPLINEETRFLIGFFDTENKSFHSNVAWSALILKNGTEIKKINNEPVKEGMDWFSVNFQESGDYKIRISIDDLPSSPGFSDTLSVDFQVVGSPDEQICDSELVLVGGECVSKDTLQHTTPIRAEKLNATQYENNAKNCINDYLPVELQYDIENGNVETICYDKNTMSLIMDVTAITPSKIIVHLPKTMITLLDQDCNSAGEIITLLNEEEIDSSRLTISETRSERIATLILPEGFDNIEFIGTYTLGKPSPLDICGSFHGYDTQYVPPLKQWGFGLDPTEVKCNKGMELLFKQNGNDPICIKTSHIEKFLERGKDIWGREFQCIPCE